MEPTLPTNHSEPPRRGWADILALLRDLRLLAFDPSLEPDDAMRRIRDRFGDYDGRFDDDC